MSRNHREVNPNRYAALDRDGWRCRDCGKAGILEVHHVVRLADGGTHDLGNLRTLCTGCHIAVHRPKPSPVRALWAEMIAEAMS